jgi:lipopolysaccharide transport system permease protein
VRPADGFVGRGSACGPAASATLSMPLAMTVPSFRHSAPSALGHRELTVIEPSTGWRMLDVRELWAYRELLWVLAGRDVRVRYKQTVLGVGWAVLRPLLSMIIFTLVFGRLARMPSDGQPYPVFVYSALLPWTFFSAAVTAAGGSLVASANLISKVYFPRLIVPLSSIGTHVVDMLVSTFVMFLLMLVYGVPWTWRLAAAPLLFLITVLTALGIGTLVSALTVAYRDVNHLLPFMMQIWMFVTPVIYPVSIVPERWRWLLALNPMTGLIEGFRSAFLGLPFDLASLAVSGAVSAAAFVVGVAYFERVERRFADVI